MTVVGRLLSRSSLENPNTPPTGWEIAQAMGWAIDGDGSTVSVESAARFSAVYRCWALIGSTIGALPLNAYVGTGGSRERYPSNVIDNPHPENTQMEVIEYLVVSMLGHGNGTAWKARDGIGRVQELWPLCPSKCRVFRDKPTDANPSGKLIEVQDPPSGAQRTVMAGVKGDVLHLPAMTLDGVVGISPIRHVASKGIQVAIAAEKFGRQMFDTGMMTNGYLKSVDELEDWQADRQQAAWARRAQGAGNNWKIPLLDGGLTFEPIGIPPEDAQYIETRRYQVTDVGRVYGVFPWMLGETEKSTSWGSGIEVQGIGFNIYTLMHWTQRIEQRMSRELLPAGRYAKFNVNALLRGDSKSRMESYVKGIQWGIYVPDEPRDWEELPPLPNGAGTKPWRPQNFVVNDGTADSGAE